MKILITKLKDRCEFDGCDRKATELISVWFQRGLSYDQVMGCYCEKHADELIKKSAHDGGDIHLCPNCECVFGEL